MRIITVDPGSTHVGYAVHYWDNSNLFLLEIGVFNFQSEHKLFNDKLNQISYQAGLEFKKLIKKYKEEDLSSKIRVAWEVVPAFGQMGYRDKVQAVASALKYSVWGESAYRGDVEWLWVTPRQVKNLTVGNSKATKEQVRKWVIEKTNENSSKYSNAIELSTVEKLQYDAYDAVAIAHAVITKKENEWWNKERLVQQWDSVTMQSNRK